MITELTDEQRHQALESIRQFFDEHLDLDIGDLKSELVLDFYLREIAPLAYNQAIRDAQKYFLEKTEDLDGSCFQDEFTFWQKK